MGIRGELPLVRRFVLGLPSAGFIIQTRATRTKTDRDALMLVKSVKWLNGQRIVKDLLPHLTDLTI
jgi:hypothetical protein